jgi:hypothetical protein
MGALKARIPTEVRQDRSHATRPGPSIWRWSLLPWLTAALGFCLGLALLYLVVVRPLRAEQKKLKTEIQHFKQTSKTEKQKTQA